MENRIVEQEEHLTRGRGLVASFETLVPGIAQAAIGRVDASSCPDPVTLAPVLAKLGRYGYLAKEEKQAVISAVSRVRYVPAGADVVREGICPGESTLLLEGFSARHRVLNDGDRQITVVHVPGDVLDFDALLLDPMDQAVTALTGCKVAVVRHEVFRQIEAAHPHLARLFWLDTLVAGAVEREWLVTMGRQTALGRMAHLLCELFLRLQVVGLADEAPGGIRGFELPLTQAHMGDALGLSVVHVNRTLQKLRAHKLVSWHGGRMTLPHWERLVGIADFSPGYLHLGKTRQP